MMGTWLFLTKKSISRKFGFFLNRPKNRPLFVGLVKHYNEEFIEKIKSQLCTKVDTSEFKTSKAKYEKK